MRREKKINKYDVTGAEYGNMVLFRWHMGCKNALAWLPNE